MSKICPLFSGSTGNSTYIAAQTGSILVDAGATLRGLTAMLAKAGGTLEEIAAVLITHEHIDHIRGLKPLLRQTGAALIASQETLEVLIAGDRVPAGTAVIPVESAHPVEAGGLLITRFATSHDCAGSSGYRVTLPDGKAITVCTDLGVVTEEVRAALRGSDAVLLESNHDIEMLKKGPYPPPLKVRILSERGHLSNPACAAELRGLLESGVRRFILGHLSQKNNTPLLAESAAVAALVDTGAVRDRDYLLSVAAPKGNKVTVL